MSLYSIATEYNGLLEATHAHIDDDRYDTDDRSAADKLKLGLSDQLRGCSIKNTIAILLRSPNELV